MATTDENKAARTQQSQEVARDAAEAYRAAVGRLRDRMKQNMLDTAALLSAGVERGPQMRALRTEAKQLVRQGRELGIPRSHMALNLGVSRQTIHDWINEGES